MDDFLIFGADIRAIRQLKIRLQSVLRMEDLGHVQQFCGTRIIRDRSKRSIHLVQDQYIERMLKAFSMQDCAPVVTPMEAGAAIHIVLLEEESNAQITLEY